MNFPTFERAMVAYFAYHNARHTGNLECMRAICFVLRNRVRAGWCNSSWLGVMQRAKETTGNELWYSTPAEQTLMEGSDRLLQMIIRDVDDIYMQADRTDDSTRRVVLGDNPPKTAALYYMFVGRPVSIWFTENIVRKPLDHPQTGNIGALMLFR